MTGGLLISAIGAVLLFMGIRAKRHYSPQNWQTTKAIVTNSYAQRLPSGINALFTPHIEYTYSVGTHSFTGSIYAYSRSEDRNGLSQVNKMLESYTVGSTIEIWHRIDSPAESCIKLSSTYSSSQMHALIVAGVALLFIGFTLHGIA